MNKDQGKVIVGLFLTTIFSAISQAVLADTTILDGGAKGGVITDLGGAKINTSTSNYAQIGITGNGNTIHWSSFNVGAGKHLDYNFTNAGQVALNKVTGGSMSTIAGQLTTSGEAGRLIISNPAGMLFDNGAVVQAHSLVLTTKDVNWDGNLNGQLQLTDKTNGLNSEIKINRANFTIADDLNIISPKISLNNFQDVLVQKDVRLITTDGVNFVADSRNVETSNLNSTPAATVDINAFNTKIAFQNAQTGKVYVVSKGDINFEKSTVKNAEMTSPGNITVKGGTMYTNTIENSNLTAKTSITVSNHNTIKDSTLKLTETAKLDSVKITVNSNNSNHTHILNSDFQGRFINAEKAVIDSSTLKSVKNMKVSGSQILDSTLDSGFQVIAENTNIKDSIIRGTNTMTFDKFSTIDNSTITLDNVMNYSVPSASTLHINDATLVNGTVVISPKICGNRSTVNNSSITATDDMSIVGATFRNGASATTKNFIYDRNHQIIRDNSTKDVTVENSTLVAENDINVVNGNLDGATLTASNSVTLNNITSAGTADNNITSDTVNINGAHNFKVKAAAADITIDNSEITTNDLSATNSLTVKNSTVSEDMNVSNAENLTVKDSTLSNIIVSNVNNIDIEGVNENSITITNSGDVLIENSTSAADPSAVTLADLMQDKELTDMYDASSFENHTVGNEFGEGERISHASGDVNISNVNNIDIINTAIEGDLTESDYSGHSNIITSYVGGTFDDESGEANIYESYINNFADHTPPVVEQPVVDTPPVEQPIVDAPPVEQPVVDAPPVEQTIVDVPPVEQPIVDAPPVEQTIVDAPPVEQTIVDAPPVEQPVVDVQPEDHTIIVTQPMEQYTVDTPSIAQTIEEGLSTDENIQIADNTEITTENNRSRYGEKLNTKAQKQFEVRGFAAGEDLTEGSGEEGVVTKKIKDVLLSAKKGENNSIITTQKFIAD